MLPYFEEIKTFNVMHSNIKQCTMYRIIHEIYRRKSLHK